MNCLIFLQEELVEPEKALVKGARVTELCKEHELSVGLSLKAGVLGGKLGTAQVTLLEKERLEAKLDFQQDSPSLLAIEALIAVPRPQTVKKCIAMAAAAGVSRVHFLRSENSVKSYLDSKSLEREAIERELRLGLQQSGTTLAPEVHVHPLFKPFVDEYLPQRLAAEKDALLLLADTAAKQSLGQLMKGTSLAKGTVFVALGPEKGWNEYERNRFKEIGFHSIGLGVRQLRVEQAFSMLIGQLQFLDDLRKDL